MTEPELDNDEYGDDDSSNDVPKPSWLKMHVGYPLYYWLRLWQLRRFIRNVRRWWHCLRFGMLPLGQWIQVESIKVCGVEQLISEGSVPGSLFSPAAMMPIGAMVEVGHSIQVAVRNIGKRPVRFRAVLELTLRDRRSMMLPLPTPLLLVDKPHTVEVVLNQLARLERLIVAEYVPKEPRVARETLQKVEQ